MDDAEAPEAHDGLIPEAVADGWTIRTYDRDGQTRIEARRGAYTVTVTSEEALARAMRDYDRYGAGSRLAERARIEGRF